MKQAQGQPLGTIFLVVRDSRWDFDYTPSVVCAYSHPFLADQHAAMENQFDQVNYIHRVEPVDWYRSDT